jgi:basic amino acid/polyamine antiporter, APA family
LPGGGADVDGGQGYATLAMARDRYLPHALAAVHPRFKVPHRAELVVGAIVAVLAATADVRGAIGFSSFGVCWRTTRSPTPPPGI